MRSEPDATDDAPKSAAAASTSSVPLSHQAELPALSRADELSTRYFGDLWKQAGVIAHQRGDDQRTAGDVGLADANLRSGFHKRKRGLRTFGQVLSLFGALAAGTGLNGIWPQAVPCATPQLSLGSFLGGLLVAIVGFFIAHNAE